MNDSNIVLVVYRIEEVLPNFMKNVGFSCSKIHRYSPTESAKVFDKPLNRRHGVKFKPKQVFDIIAKGPLPQDISDDEKRFLVEAYLDVSMPSLLV